MKLEFFNCLDIYELILKFKTQALQELKSHFELEFEVNRGDVTVMLFRVL
jgi:hypothetical protein